MALTGEQVEQFVADGFVKVERAFDHEVGERCRNELWAASACDPWDPTIAHAP